MKIELDASPALLKVLGEFVTELRRFNNNSEAAGAPSLVDEEENDEPKTPVKKLDPKKTAPAKKKAAPVDEEEIDEEEIDEEDLEEEEDDAAPTQDRLRELVNEKVQAGHRDEVKEIMRKIGGTLKASQVPADKIKKVYDKIKALK